MLRRRAKLQTNLDASRGSNYRMLRLLEW